jgi:hypothetical protein
MIFISVFLVILTLPMAFVFKSPEVVASAAVASVVYGYSALVLCSLYEEIRFSHECVDDF